MTWIYIYIYTLPPRYLNLSTNCRDGSFSFKTHVVLFYLCSPSVAWSRLCSLDLARTGVITRNATSSTSHQLKVMSTYICLVKAWTAIDRLSIIWKSDLSDKIKRVFFPNCSCVSTTVWIHHMDANKTFREKSRWELHNNDICCFEKIRKITPHKTASVRRLSPFSKTT